MYAIPTAGVAFAAAVLPALVQAQAVAPGSVPDFTLGGAASTVTVAGIQPFTVSRFSRRPTTSCLTILASTTQRPFRVSPRQL